MEIRRIDPYTFENFDKYMLVMPINSIDEADNYCSLEIDGKLFIAGKKENGVVFVENDNGFLNPYEVKLDEDGYIETFDTEEDSYLLKRKGYEAFIQRKDKLSCNVYSIALIKETVEPFFEYRQFDEESFTVFIKSYRTLAHSANISSAIAFTNYHLPTHLELHQACNNNFFSHEKVKFYYLTEDEKTYRRALIVRDRSYHLPSLTIYDGEKLIALINEAYGFQKEIDSSLKAYVNGENQEYNKTRKLVNTYQDYIIGHK